MDDRTNELIQRDVDGDLGPGEHAALDAALAADPDARAARESIQGLARELDALPQLEAPPMFAARVLQAAGNRTVPPAAFIPPSQARRRVFAIAGYAAAAGLVLGLLAGPLLMRSDLLAPARLPGVVAGAMGGADFSSWDLVNRRTVAARGGSVTLVVRRNGPNYAVETAGEAISGAAASIVWDPSRLELVALVTARASGAIEVTPGRLLWRLAEGERLTAVLAARGAPGSIHLDVDGIRLLSSDLTLGDDRK